MLAYRNLQTLKSYFFLSGNQNCLYHKHHFCLTNLDKVGEFGKKISKEDGTCYFYYFFQLPVESGHAILQGLKTFSFVFWSFLLFRVTLSLKGVWLKGA